MKTHRIDSRFMFFLTIWIVLLQLIVLGVISALDNAKIIYGNIVLHSPWFMIGMLLAMLLLPLFIWLTVKGEKFTPTIPNQNLGGKNIILIVVISLLIQPAMMVLSGITALFSPNQISEMMYASLEQPFWLMLIATAVTPAVCEELVFRGYLQTKQRDRKLKQVAVLNGLFFAIIHLNIQQFLYAFVLGVLFVYMVHYTRSVWAGILSHFAINAGQLLLGRWAMADSSVDAEMQAAERIIPQVSPEIEAIIIVGGFALLLAPIIVMLVRAFFRHNQRVHGNIDEPNETTEVKKLPFFDRYLVAVIAIFLALQVMMFI